MERAGDRERERARDLDLGPEEGGGPPVGTAWTLEVAGDGGWSADLAHAAPLPRVGDAIEYIAADGTRSEYVVRDVVHTLQPAASERPPVSAEDASPNAIVAGARGAPHELRAGLPRVVVEPRSS